MEDVFRSGFFDKQPTKSTKETGLAKRDDVDLIVATLLKNYDGKSPSHAHL